MAWWNQPEGSVTPTVTLRRLAAWFAERGYGYDMDLSEGVVRSRVAGFDYVLMVVDRRILVVRAHHQFDGPAPGPAELSRVRAVAQEVSSGRLIPALYTEVDDAGLGLCAEALINIAVGLDDAQLAGAMDFALNGIDDALREVLDLLDGGAGTRRDIDSDPEPARAQEAAVVALPEATDTAGSAEPVDPTRLVDVAEPAGQPDTSADTPTEAVMDGMTDATVEMAIFVDGPGADAHARVRAGIHAEPAAGVKSDKGTTSPGDADGGTEVETTDTPEPLLVS